MIKVIGIDPAPSKKSTIYDGDNFYSFDYVELKAYLEKIKKDNENNKILICWDAPLSFSLNSTSPFTKRDIEKFFSRIEGEKTPSGISIMGYSTCPHWIITQNLLGYPRTMDCVFKHPYNLVFNIEDINYSITEVHPAVAIWLWLKKINPKIKVWDYKKNKTTFENIKNELVKNSIIPENTNTNINNDDDLDAYISWKLGYDWINNNSSVKILGNSDTGSFLLPYNKSLYDKFGKFIGKKTASS